jgi:DNA-3-methyladenine glycosylase
MLALDPRLRFDPEALRMQEIPRRFYLDRTDLVARKLIGKWIGRRHGEAWYGGRIVEVEAYVGSRDAAAHSYRGRRTARVEPMYLEGGHLYVFFVYGMHYCANIVTRPEGFGEAVLLRAVEGPAGAPARLMSGPGRLCSALHITGAMSGMDLIGADDLRLFAPRSAEAVEMVISRRIGVDYAGAARDWQLRFFDLRSQAVSGPARLRMPAE